MINKIFHKAKIIRSATPYSFRLFFEKLEIFKPNSKKHKELNERIQPEQLIALPILPSEIFYVAYNKIVTCPDKNCQNFKNLFDYEKNNLVNNDFEINGNNANNAIRSNIGFFEEEGNNGNSNINNAGCINNNIDKENNKETNIRKFEERDVRKSLGSLNMRKENYLINLGIFLLIYLLNFFVEISHKNLFYFYLINIT